MTRIAVVAVALALGLAACGTASGHPAGAAVSSPVPSGGVSRERAEDIATTGFDATAYRVESAVFGKFSQFAPGQSTSHSSDKGTFTSTPDELVWAETVGGVFVHPCPCCGQCDPAHHETVLIDYYSGEPMFYVLSA